MEQEKIMTMISYAGAAKTKLMLAMREAGNSNYEKVNQLIDEADADLELCHKTQTEILFSDCNNIEGKETNNIVSVLLVHAMDQVMDAMAMRDMVYEIVNLVRRIRND